MPKAAFTKPQTDLQAQKQQRQQCQSDLPAGDSFSVIRSALPLLLPALDFALGAGIA
jgi:hypothetical protein